MRVLVDTSVWVEHFRRHRADLVRLLDAGRVVSHPLIVLEIACGTPPRRKDVIGWLGALASVPQASHAEVLELLERRRLWGRGCGSVDLCLLASVLVDGGACLWTLDRRLAELADELGVRWA